MIGSTQADRASTKFEKILTIYGRQLMLFQGTNLYCEQHVRFGEKGLV
jgi:hypothetical protein